MAREVFFYIYYLVTHFCFEFWYSHFSSESYVIPGLYFTSRMGFVFENNRYRTMRLLSHPVIIFLCSQFFFKPIFFLTAVIALAVSIETSEHVWIEIARTSSWHIIRASSCSLFTHVPCRVSTPTRTHTQISHSSSRLHQQNQ